MIHRLSRTNTILLTSIGAGVVICGLVFRRWIRAYPKVTETCTKSLSQLSLAEEMENIAYSSTGYRTAQSKSSRRSRTHLNVSMPPAEADLISGLDACNDMSRFVGRALAGLDMLRNRSPRDKDRADLLSSIADRLRILETDLTSIVRQGGFEQCADIGDSYTGGSVRSRTLSIFSDDSFTSAVEDFDIPLGEDHSGKTISVDPVDMILYKEGLEAAMSGEIAYRKDRSNICQCASEMEFAAKVWCLRKAFHEIVSDEHNRVWLAKAGRQLLGDLLKQSKQDPSSFYKTYDEMMSFLENDDDWSQTEEELHTRGVADIGFWDVVVDFILLDSFDDLKSPPSAINSVTKNYYLAQSLKYSTISTIIWSMLKAKRQRLKNLTGFIAHFYDISGAISPAITLGFLGTDDSIKELCYYFKEQITQFVIDIFSGNRVRYTSVQELSNDVWLILQDRTEAVMTRMSTEISPV